MELTKIRSLGDAELAHQEKVAGEQLFRLRFQVSMGQNDGVKKLRQLRKEIAQIKTVTRERELGIRGAQKDLDGTVTAKSKAAKAEATVTAEVSEAATVEAKTEARPKAAAKAKAPTKTKVPAKAKKGAAE